MKTPNIFIKASLVTLSVLCVPVYAMMQKAEQRLARPAASALSTCAQRFFANPGAQRACQAVSFGTLSMARNLSYNSPRIHDKYFDKATEDLGLHIQDLKNFGERKITLSKEVADKELKMIKEKDELRKKITSLEYDYELLTNKETSLSEPLKKTLIDNLKEQDKNKKALWDLEFKEKKEQLIHKTPQSEKRPTIIDKMPTPKK